MKQQVIFQAVVSCQVRDLNTIYDYYFPNKSTGLFVEVGAYDGIQFSNTYHLAKLGWEGILFEPHPQLYQDCIRNLKNVNCKVHQLGISTQETTMNLFDGGALSSTSAKTIAIYKNVPWGQRRKYNPISIQTKTLDNMLGDIKTFDLLVVDTEGTEMDVLNSFSIKKYKPSMCIIEAHEWHGVKALRSQAEDINAYFEKAKYTKIYCDEINNIYVSPALIKKYGIIQNVYLKEHK